MDENADESAAYHLLETMIQEINQKANAFMADEQSFAYRLRLLESANGIQVSGAYGNGSLPTCCIMFSSHIFSEVSMLASCAHN